MPYPCPFKDCDVVGTYPHNLKKHLTGTKAYGGHELSKSKADLIVKKIQSGKRFSLEENNE